MNTPTPETDAAEWSAENVPLVVSSDFARKLERERDEARRLAEEWRDNCHPPTDLLPWEIDPNGIFTAKLTTPNQ